MPLKARLVIVAYAGFYLLINIVVLGIAVVSLPQWWMSAVLLVVLLTIAIVLLDAFYPKVSLFVPSLYKIPQYPGKKTIALTFDDGPVQPYTAQILDILDRYAVKATFFCIGENVQRHPELAMEIVRRGHTLGNHSQTHQILLLASAALVSRELREAQLTMQKACGIKPLFFRCPKGYKSPIVAFVLRRFHLALVAYGYPIFDVENPPADELVTRVLQRAAAGDMVLMHDGFPPGKPGKRDSLVAALPLIIEGLLEKGLQPISLDQISWKKT